MRRLIFECLVTQNRSANASVYIQSRNELIEVFGGQILLST